MLLLPEVLADALGETGEGVVLGDMLWLREALRDTGEGVLLLVLLGLALEDADPLALALAEGVALAETVEEGAQSDARTGRSAQVEGAEERKRLGP